MNSPFLQGQHRSHIREALFSILYILVVGCNTYASNRCFLYLSLPFCHFTRHHVFFIFFTISTRSLTVEYLNDDRFRRFDVSTDQSQG